MSENQNNEQTEPYNTEKIIDDAFDRLNTIHLKEVRKNRRRAFALGTVYGIALSASFVYGAVIQYRKINDKQESEN